MSSKWNWFVTKYLPYLWGVLIVAIVTGGLIGVIIAVVKWICKLVGVI